MSDPVPEPKPTVVRRPGLFPVVAVLLAVLAVLLVLARVVPGPHGLRVTVLETGRVATSPTNQSESP